MFTGPVQTNCRKGPPCMGLFIIRVGTIYFEGLKGLVAYEYNVCTNTDHR